MSSERRRSARLIENPWVYNWPKRPAVYITLDGDSAAPVQKRRNIETHSREKQVNKMHSGAVITGLNSSSTRPSLVSRAPRGIGNLSLGTEQTDDDDDFVTPAEHFGKAKSIGLQRQENKLKNKEVDKITKKRNRATEGTRNCEDDTVAEGSRRRYMDKGRGKKGEHITGVDGQKVLISKYPVRDDVDETEPPKNDKPKKVRAYEGYLEKKFSPSIITYIVKNLTVEQANWVKTTGFGELLSFDMSCHAHKLGYNLVEAFDVHKCALALKCGTIEINDRLVHRVIGLPRGQIQLTETEDQSNVNVWGGQFGKKAGCEIPPRMVRNKLIENRNADKLFKLNFLVMVYNFFIEAHQNRYVNRDVLRLELNLDACGQYNWCSLLIAKLQSSCAYWNADRKRNFTGSLPLLTFLYLSKVRNNKYVYVPPVFPSYRGWSDMLIKERQKIEITEGSFGEGEIVPLIGEIEEVTVPEDPVKNIGDREMIHDDEVIADTDDSQPDSDDERTDATELDYSKQVEVIVTGKTDEVIGATKTINTPNLGLTTRSCSTTEPLMENQGVQDGENQTEQFMTSLHRMGSFVKKFIVPQGTTSINQNPVLLESETVIRGDEVHRDNMVGKKLASVRGGIMQTPSSEALKLSGARVEETAAQGTQGTIEDVIDQHFQEDKYMGEFRRNINDMRSAYERCLNNYEVGLALYSSNAELAQLRDENRDFFQLFEKTSPLSKLMLGGTRKTRDNAVAEQGDDLDFAPSFSLGLSQITPKKLGDVMDVLHNEKNKAEENQLVQRPRRGVKVSEILRSPYVSRVLDIVGHKVTNEERIVWEWLFENRQNRREYLFEFHSIKCTKANFQSLQPNCLVDIAVIDAWSYLLNGNEALRAKTSPFRLFLTSDTSYGPMKLKKDSTDRLWKMRRNAMFKENMDVGMKTMFHLHNRVYDVKEFDMFIFPIHDSSHQYLISYNMKKPMWDIIDNRVPIAGLNGFKRMYGDLPYLLHECFCEWISTYKLPKETEIVNLSPRVVRMGWQTKENTVDRGIFIMRVMETYMGTLLGWSTGLRTENDNQKNLLNKLRVVYGHKILTWEQNSKRAYVMGGATYLDKGKKIAE